MTDGVNPDLIYRPRNTVAEFVDKYGERRTIHRPKGRALRVAKNTGDTPTEVFGRAVAILLGQRVKARRLALGLSQRDLCVRAGMADVSPKQRIHAIENATRGQGIRLGTLYVLALALECELENLLPSLSEVRQYTRTTERTVRVVA